MRSQKEDQIEKVDSKTPQTQVDSLSPSASLEYRGDPIQCRKHEDRFWEFHHIP